MSKTKDGFITSSAFRDQISKELDTWLYLDVPPCLTLTLPTVSASTPDMRSFLRLPNEILEDVGNASCKVDLICLSWTCRRLYLLLHPQILRATTFSDQKRHVLLRIEDDSPDLLLCHRCLKLFKWRICKPKLPITLGFRPLHHSCPNRNNSKHWHDPGFALCGSGGPLHFKRETRDLILRYYHKGQKYGLPITSIEHSCRGERPFNDQKAIKTTLKAKILDGNLMLWRTDELEVWLWARYIRQEISKFDGRICPHLGPHITAFLHFQVESVVPRIGSDYSTQYRPDASRRCLKNVRCRVCNTDIRIDIILHPDETALIRVNAWYNFGTRNEYLMSEQDDAVKANWQHADTMINPYSFCGLEQLFNGSCTHLPSEADYCREARGVFSNVYPCAPWTYGPPEYWEFNIKQHKRYEIEVPEVSYRKQQHGISDFLGRHLRERSFPSLRRPGCYFSRPDADLPFLKQAAGLYFARLEFVKRWDLEKSKGKTPLLVFRYERLLTCSMRPV